MTEAHDFELEIDNLPNRLTIFRVLLIPIVVGSLFLIKYPYSYTVGMEDTLGWFAGWIFTLASITDFLDGYIARKKNIVTVFGSFLDPIADKFLVVSSLIMLLYLDRIHSILVIILILREMYITSLRLLAYSEDVQVPVSQLAKWKTATQMVGIPCLMVNHQWWIIPFDTIGTYMIYVSVALSVLSATLYSLKVVVKIKERRKQKRLMKKAQVEA